jgi:hypothetical protein
MTMKVDMSPAAIDRRLREASRLAGPLRPETRLATKIDLSGAGVTARLREASDLAELCRSLAQVGRRGGNHGETGPGHGPGPG